MTYRRTSLAAVVALLLALAACSHEKPTQGPTPRPEGVYALPAASLEDTELVVSTDGDDDAAGTPDAPLRTIDAAARRAEPGSTILVRDGVYTGDVKTEANGSESARIAYVAESPNVRIVGSKHRNGVWENNGDYVDIVGFDVTGPNGVGIYNRGSQVRIMQNRVHDIPGNCIYTQNDDYSLTDIDVIGNVVFDCGESTLDHGIYVTQRRGLVSNNISYRNTGFGIQCWHACDDIIVVNNLVFDNHEGGIVIGGEINDHTGTGSVTDHSLVANNIAVDNGRDGIREGSESGPDNRFVDNLLWGNQTDDISLSKGKEVHTMVEDPMFVNFKPDGSGDYRLDASSPALNAGTTDMAPPVAIDRAPRPQSGGIDLGPYER
jgi:pectate disaccharide-lyase